MNLSSIKTGDLIANYPKMCKLLSENQRKGSPRDRQVEDWKRFFNFEKQGHKFKVIEIYQNEKPKIDGRTEGNHSVYVQYTSLLLLDYLCVFYERKTTIEIFNREVISITGLCNENFINNDESFFNELYSDKGIRKSDKNNFYQRANDKINQIIKSTFKQLNNNYKFIEIKEIYILAEKGNSKDTRIATDEEIQIIKQTNDAVLKRLGAKNMFTIYARNQDKIFYSQVKDILLEKYNWTISYKTNKISFIEDVSIHKGKYALTEEKKAEYITIVNQEIHTFLDKQAEKVMAKSNKNNDAYKIKRDIEVNKINTDKPIEKKHRVRPSTSLKIISDMDKFYKLHDKYIENQKYLSSLLIHIETECEGIEDINIFD